MAELNRRDFVAATAASVALVVLGSADALAQSAGPAQTSVEIGKPADFPAGGISDKFARSDKLIIAHSNDRIYAMTAVCTHRKGTIVIKDGKFRCPSHNSYFSEEGKPVSGPAKQSLNRYAISLNKEGTLVVDKTKTFDETKWNDPDAYFTVKTA